MKVLVTGDGGMIYVEDRERAVRTRRLAYHGLAQPSGFGHAKVSSRWWELDIPEPGRRVIGNDLTAAIGAVQLRRLPRVRTPSQEICALYDRELAEVPGVLLPPALPDGHESTHYFYWVQTDPEIRDQLAGDLYQDGIYTTFRYAPLHKVPAFGSQSLQLPRSDWAAERTPVPAPASRAERRGRAHGRGSRAQVSREPAPHAFMKRTFRRVAR